MLRLDSGHLKTKTMCEHVVNPIHDGGGGGAKRPPRNQFFLIKLHKSRN